MTKEAKARMIAFYEERLNYLDELIELNKDNQVAVKMFLKQYKEMAKNLAAIRDRLTTD
jgi:hypothetical protein